MATSLISRTTFARTIQQFCSRSGWKLADITDHKAILRFTMPSGRNQTMFIMRYDTTLEFSVPSMMIFDSDDVLPHPLSTTFLRRNAKNKIGFWCIEQIGGKYVYSYMHNAELALIDAAYFSRVVQALITACDELEGILMRVVQGNMD